MDLLIRNGRVYTPEGPASLDIAVDEGVIAGLAPEIREDAIQVIDAEGMEVFPGFIDPHTHMELPVAGTVSSDDFFTGTRAAAAGGITTIIDFCSQLPGQTFEQVVGIWKNRAAKSVIDYGFHIIVPQLTPEQIRQVPDLVAEGISTVKCMMAYKRGPQASDDANLLRVIAACRDAGALPMVHAENGDAIDVRIDTLLAQGRRSPRFHPVSRPPLVEAEAVNRAGALAALADYCVYIVHLSSAEALDALQIGLGRGWQMYAETCPQYLLLDDSVYDTDSFEAAKFVCSPPLRPASGQEALWKAVARGPLRLIASDHCPFRYQGQKDIGRDDFSLIPNGIPTIEAMFPLIYSAGVRMGRCTAERFVDISSTHAARMFGLYPRKGAICEGADADLVIFDPHAVRTLAAETLHSRVDYTPYEGRTVNGWPAWTVARGDVLYSRGEFTESLRPGRGAFLARSPWHGDPLA